jgi:hypothetical protein
MHPRADLAAAALINTYLPLWHALNTRVFNSKLSNARKKNIDLQEPSPDSLRSRITRAVWQLP